MPDVTNDDVTWRGCYVGGLWVMRYRLRHREEDGDRIDHDATVIDFSGSVYGNGIAPILLEFDTTEGAGWVSQKVPPVANQGLSPGAYYWKTFWDRDGVGKTLLMAGSVYVGGPE